MGECGCSDSPDHCFIVQTKSGDKVVIAVWERTCQGCDSEPLVMAGEVTDEEIEDFWYGTPVHKSPPMNGNAFVILSRAAKLDELLEEALNHMTEEHVHDREECPDIFTKKGRPRAKWLKT